MEKIKDKITAIDNLLIELLFGGTDGEKSRLKRFKENYLTQDGLDKEQIENLAYKMLIDDLNTIRS